MSRRVALVLAYLAVIAVAGGIGHLADRIAAEAAPGAAPPAGHHHHHHHAPHPPGGRP